MAQTGRILQFERSRGFGFIAPDAGGEDVFLHINEFDGDEVQLSPGVRVAYEVVDGERGKKAYAIRLARGEPGARGVPAGVAASSAADDPASDDQDGLCDVLTVEEMRTELTELFLASSPELTGSQILGLREGVLRLARKHGWLEG
ncbi:cold-shock protein [Actinomadura sp. 3N407]|uniref:cold-shock protein n=1 Tax=Actinomadura sp. 3N407 TaxID=3457423 RepID=UPI003FCE6ECA